MISNQEIEETQNNLIQNIEKLIRQNKKMPKGSLKVSLQNGHFYYYQYDSADAEHPHGKYISKKNGFLIKQLAQKTYNEELIEIYQKQLGLLSNLSQKYNWNADVQAYLDLSECRKKLVEPVALPDEMFVEKWYWEKEQLISSKPNEYEKNYVIITERGEMVRSKSEKIIADKIFRKKIPYVYECPLLLPDGHLVYPDFTLLDVKNRREIYFEHLGMMDNPEYSRAAIEKIYRYESNGYMLGKSLLIDFETRDFSVDTNHLNIVLDSIFK